MTLRPNVEDPHEKAVIRDIAEAGAERDRAMAEEGAGIEVTADPQPVVRSWSRGPVDHDVPEEVAAWIAREDEDQMGHYQRIYQEMERLAPSRDRWIAEFFERISGPRGYSVHAGQRRTIPEDEIPQRPDRPWRVVW